MSALRDALSNLEEQTHQIHDLAIQTASRPLAGRFTKAYLQGTHNIFGIIREAANHERGLFNFIGESGMDESGKPVVEGMAPSNMVERRKPGVVTPLRKPPAAGGDDPIKLLDKALTLVDEYRSMPRARAHVVDLMDSFLTTQQAIKDLEQQIEEAKQGGAKPGSKPKQQPVQVEDTPEPTFDDPEDWLKAEEEAVKRLEKEIAIKRRNQPAAASRSRGSNYQNEMESTPSPTLLTRTSRPLSMASPGSPLKSMRFPASPRRRERTAMMQTPVKQTPLRMGVTAESPDSPMTNKDEETITPTRPGANGSPGRVLGSSTGPSSKTTTTTPRFAQPTTSLAAKINALTPHRSRTSPSVNEKRRITSYSAPQDVISPGPFSAGAGPGAGGAARGKRVGLFALGRKESPRKRAEEEGTPEKEQKTLGETVGESTIVEARHASPTPGPEPEAGEVGDETITGPANEVQGTPDVVQVAQEDPVVEGVKVDNPAVKDGIDTVWTLVPEVLRSEEAGPEVCAGKTLGVRDTILLLAKISEVTDIRAPSPSNVSVASSSIAGAPPAPIKPPPTTDANVLMCHLILYILRSEGVVVSMLELKRHMDDVSTGKGWEGREGNNAFYAAVAKRLIKIDRKGPMKGGTVRLDKV